MKGYEAKVVSSSRELTAKERIRIKDFSNATQLDDVVTPDQSFILDYDYHAFISVHNEHTKSGQTDYEKCVIVDRAGNMYVTGSESFITAMESVLTEMKAAGSDEEFSLECYKVPSKNFNGKHFLTCTIV